MAPQALLFRQPQRTGFNGAAGVLAREKLVSFSFCTRDFWRCTYNPPSMIWNVDETWFTTVQNSQKVVTSKGILSDGKRTSGERLTLITMLWAFLTLMYFFPRLSMSENGIHLFYFAITQYTQDDHTYLKFLKYAFIQACVHSHNSRTSYNNTVPFRKQFCHIRVWICSNGAAIIHTTRMYLTMWIWRFTVIPDTNADARCTLLSLS